MCGYGCEDHYLEQDTFLHCNESLASLLQTDLTHNILVDLGMPILHHGVRYNCRVFCLNSKILLIRPKLFLADDGNYREGRYFTPYKPSLPPSLETHLLPPLLRRATGQTTVPFGVGAVATLDTIIGSETCEELWTARAPHIEHFLGGVEVIGNGSASHHQLRKLDERIRLICAATEKCGGVYLYANQCGCDGGRMYFDGSSLIVVNGRVLAQAPQFSVRDVEVVVATVDLEEVRSKRAFSASIREQASRTEKVPQVYVGEVEFVKEWSSSSSSNSSNRNEGRKEEQEGGGGGKSKKEEEEEEEYEWQHLSPTLPLDPSTLCHFPEEECGLGPACWLWDYLRRSGAGGFLLPLSGGADSAAVAAIVGVMCHLLFKAVREEKEGEGGREGVRRDVRRAMGYEEGSDFIPSSPQEIANSVLHTVYMGTSNSSSVTRSRAAALAGQIGAFHYSLSIDSIVSAVLGVFTLLTGGVKPRYLSQGGTATEDLALQNIQARLRMVVAYLLAQLTPWVRGMGGGSSSRNNSSSSNDGSKLTPQRRGFLLVLGSANVDESLRGYMTKYDCSSADLNPIGSISKGDLKSFLFYASQKYNYSVLADIAAAPPTAELRPMEEGEEGGGEGGGEGGEHSQVDEEDMGMSYKELGLYGRLRKIERCGPVSMFLKLLPAWPHLNAREIGEKVKLFFKFYAMNRHKMTTLTPAYHAESYSPDDNRFDLRPFLYPVRWPRQFGAIDSLVERRMRRAGGKEGGMPGVEV